MNLFIDGWSSIPYIVLFAIIVSIVSTIHKVHEIRNKEKIIKKIKHDFSFLMSKAMMQFFSFMFLSVILIYSSSTIVPLIEPLSIIQQLSIVAIVIIGSIFRFIVWYHLNKIRASYDIEQQKTPEYTLLENFAGPWSAGLTFCFCNLIMFGELTVFAYLTVSLLSTVIFFQTNDIITISGKMKEIIFYQGLLVAVESISLFALVYFIDKNTNISTNQEGLHLLPFLINNLSFYLFLVVIALSSLFCFLFYCKDMKRKKLERNKYSLKSGIKVGFFGGIHDVLYFIIFFCYGPMFLIIRRIFIKFFQDSYSDRVFKYKSWKKIFTERFPIKKWYNFFKQGDYKKFFEGIYVQFKSGSYKQPTSIEYKRFGFSASLVFIIKTLF